jgi:hypothetical protein
MAPLVKRTGLTALSAGLCLGVLSAQALSCGPGYGRH